MHAIRQFCSVGVLVAIVLVLTSINVYRSLAISVSHEPPAVQPGAANETQFTTVIGTIKSMDTTLPNNKAQRNNTADDGVYSANAEEAISEDAASKSSINSLASDAHHESITKWRVRESNEESIGKEAISAVPEVSTLHAAATTTTTTTSIPPRIAYIAFCHLQGTQRMEDFIFSSVETWHPRDRPYFVVFTASSKPIWDDYVVTNSNFTKYQARIQPLFVDCPEGKFGESPCCKQEKGLLAVLDQYGSSYDWFLFQDDDVYLRHEYLQSFVTPLNPNQVQILSAGMPAKRLGHMGYELKTKQTYVCSKNDEYTYPWGMPVLYSKAALLHVSNGFRQGGLVRQCVVFNITHDTGNAMFHWMYSLPSIWLRVPPAPGWLRDDFFGNHGIGRATEFKSPNETTMFVLHRKYTTLLKFKRYPTNHIYAWHNVTGFRTTKTFKDYGDPAYWTEWHTFPVDDCLGLGR
jgi:hypothetical protein